MSPGRANVISETLDPLGWACFASARGDDGNDLLFITRDFNRGLRKENGTIPFYGRFLKKTFRREIREFDTNSKEESRKECLGFKNEIQPSPAAEIRQATQSPTALNWVQRHAGFRDCRDREWWSPTLRRFFFLDLATPCARRDAVNF